MRKKRLDLWTPEENEIGRRLLENSASEAEFLEKLGRNKKSASSHFYYLERRAKVLQRRGETLARSKPGRQATIDDAQCHLVVPRSPTSEFFGDPPPGRSALDRK
jgi:hypothetical protein